MHCISIVRSLHFRIFSASFLITFLSPERVYHFAGSKIGKRSCVGRGIIIQQEKISRAECSWMNPVNALQEVIHYSFIKFCISWFSLWYEFFMYYTLRVEKNYQHGLDARPLEFQFLRPRGCPTNLFRTLSLCFGVIGKTPGLIPCNNFVKIIVVCIGHRDSFGKMWLYLPFAQVSRSVEQKVHTAFSFPNPLSESKELQFWDVQRYCYHSWCNSMVIFDQSTNSSVYHSSGRFWMATSLVIFYQLPSVSKSRTPPKFQ
jgi:hypothetical protein